MEIIYKGVDELIPYINNTRTHTEEQINQIAGSIQEFGFNNPILIDDNNNVIAGHARLKASKKLGLDQVPCVVLNQMTEAQKKAYVIADNKMALNAGWDIDMLKVELEALEELDFDLELTGFNLAELDLIFEEEDAKPKKVNERQRTNNAYNLELFDEFVCDGKYQMPIIENDNFIPTNIIGFNYAKTSKDKNVGIHFYIDDYQFERVWNAPSDYTNILDQYECIFTPDFSLYLDMPLAMKIWNVYRSRLIGQFYQQQGLKVIPTISWAEKETFEFCFDGIPQGSIVSVSTIGVKQNEIAMQIWVNGMDAMIEKIKPSTILVYGGEVDYDYKGINVVYYKNAVTERMKENGSIEV